MPDFSVFLDETTARFYARLAQSLELPTQKVLSDALFKLAGELSLEALAKQQQKS